MNPIPLSSVALTNLFALVCRLISCDSEYEYPNVNAGATALGRSVDSEGFSNNVIDPQENLEVTTKTGRLRGYYMTNIRGGQISAFEGIPFAEAPIGDRRFKPPVPKKPWNGTLIANNPGSPCIQLHYGRLRGAEDCLNLNLYTKSVNPQKPYPVIIFIHGGFWLSGGGQYFGPAYLLVNDVILVTIAYRLGPLGFFTTGDEEAMGNNGLRDQTAAIDWVYNNIAMFGGDPSKITLAGSSAGSASIHFQMMSNYESTKQKIKGAISMSGTAYNIWAINKLDTSKMVSMHLANVSGCPTYRDSHEVVNCLRRVDARVLVANQLFTFQTGFFIPSIEPEIPGAFLTRNADQAYLDGKVARVPWVVSMTSRELNLPVTALQANVVVRILRTAFSTNIANLLTFRGKGVDEDDVRRKIVKFYTGSDSVNTLSQEALSQIATDRYFTVPIRKAIQMHSQVAPTYASIFNYSSNLGRAGRLGLNPTIFGTLHGDDLVYFLNSTKHHPPIGRYDSHFAITKLLVNVFSNFAAYGEPLYESETKEIFKIWDKVDDLERLRFLWIDEEVKMVDDPFKNVTDFWEQLGVPDMTSSFKL